MQYRKNLILGMLCLVTAVSTLAAPSSNSSSTSSSKEKESSSTSKEKEKAAASTKEKEKEKDSAKEKDACRDTSTTAQINACAKQEADAAEVKLGNAYKKVLTMLSKPDDEIVRYAQVKKNLIDAQRAWVVFRQKECDAVQEFYLGGTIRTAMVLSCMKRLAEQRTKEFEDWTKQ